MTWQKFTWNNEKSMCILGNCLEVIKKIPDKSIQSVITDPPYFMGLTHNGQKGTLSDLNIATPFFKELFQEIKRVLTEDGCVYFFCDWRGYAFYYPLFDEAFGADNMIVWDKGGGTGNFYTYNHELIIFHTNNRKFHKKGCKNIIREVHGFCFADTKKQDGEKVHPTQKPVELIKKLMIDSTEEGDTVLDCFGGSFTTGVAGIRTNRNVIAVELTDKYFAVGCDRIERELLRNRKDSVKDGEKEENA